MDKIDLGNFNFTVCPPGREILSGKTIIFRTACVSTVDGDMQCSRNIPPSRNCDDYVVYPMKKLLQGGGSQQCFLECFTTYPPNESVNPNSTSTQFVEIPTSAAVTAYPTFIITFVALIFALLLSSKRSH
ncbi:hypothetical protein MFLAVUS_000363 [Mucor flavus]|uniref:Uncharacterized protein n=1 Tax=Mucor flavus TaxID=439312 RepID=A0ABP9YJH7_9FUNG